MKVISLDIETLGTAADAVVASIGAVVVTPDGMGDEYYQPLDLQEQLDKGRTVTENTLRFWFDQDRDVRQATFPMTTSCVRSAMELLRTFIDCAGMPLIYCKGPQFDGAILQSLCDTFSVDCPVHYRAWRDNRTIEDVLVCAGYEADLLDVKHAHQDFGHHALADAKRQGEVVRLAMTRGLV